MTKVEWLKKQIAEAAEGLNDLDAAFIPRFVQAVEAAGDDISRTGFLSLFESFRPEDAGPEYYDYMILDTQFCYCSDFSEVWHIAPQDPLPEVTTKAFYKGVELPEDFVKLGGMPDWVQDEAFPICEQCDGDMVLFAQFKSLSQTDNHPELSAFVFGDVGNLYVFTCPNCGAYKTDLQCH